MLESYYDELQKQQQNSDYQPSCSMTQMMDNCNQLVQEFNEELKALNKKKERTLLAQKLFGLEPSNLQTLPVVEKQINTGLKTFAVYQIIKDQFDEWAKTKFSVLDTNKLEIGCKNLF